MSFGELKLFVNPTAGRGQANRRVPAIVDLLRKSGVVVDVFASEKTGDIENVVRDAVDSGSGEIIVAGGDGSVHEAVNGIMQSGRTARLGVIPIGTGNDFAKACGISLEWQTATRLLANRIEDNATLITIDVGRMNDRHFSNGAGIGFDAKVNRLARNIRWPIGDAVYLVAVMKGLADGIITPDLHIKSPTREWSGPVTLANISNGPWVGGMFYIAPMADNSDGQLDLVIADPVSRSRVMTLIPKLIKGTHIEETEIHHDRVDSLKISAKEPVPSHLDGEVQALQTEFDISVVPAALTLL